MTLENQNSSEKISQEETIKNNPNQTNGINKTTSFSKIWDKILHFGVGETVLRISTGIASIILIILVVWVMSRFFIHAQKDIAVPTNDIEARESIELLPTNEANSSVLLSSFGITRLVNIHTNLPAKQRNDLIEYTIQEGDTLFGIAEKYGLKPESLLLSNRHILGDDPHNIIPGWTILIPPVDGAVYFWNKGDGLNGVSSGYGVTPEVIVDWPGNNLDRATLGDFRLPNILEGTRLFVPGGYTGYIDWLPTFTRDNPAVASSMGPGFCGEITEGDIGTGSFIWPSTETYLSGYDYTPSTNHFGIDIAGAIGNPIYAVDTGVVVYSGWNNNGYGNLIIVDHGNNWQSVYAHLDSVISGCGQSVQQGEIIGYLGTTGNSSGPHLHFELRNLLTGKVNPWDFLVK